MHPVIRIVCFLVFIAALARAGLAEYLSAAGVLLLAYLVSAQADFSRALRMLLRLRWLFLSIGLIYLAFTPGRPLGNLAWAPSAAGLRGAAGAVFNLVLVVSAVNLLLNVTTRTQLLAALRKVLAPAKFLGLPVDALALRLLLVFDSLPRVEDIVRERLKTLRAQSGGLSRYGDTLAALFSDVVRRADEFPLRGVRLEPLAAVRYRQWMYPLLLALLILAPARIVAMV